MPEVVSRPRLEEGPRRLAQDPGTERDASPLAADTLCGAAEQMLDELTHESVVECDERSATGQREIVSRPGTELDPNLSRSA